METQSPCSASPGSKSRLLSLPPELRQGIFFHIFTPTIHLNGSIPEHHPILPQELPRLKLHLSPCLQFASPRRLPRREACQQEQCSHPDTEVWPSINHSKCLEQDIDVQWMRTCKLIYAEATAILCELVTVRIPEPEVLQRLALNLGEEHRRPWSVISLSSEGGIADDEGNITRDGRKVSSSSPPLPWLLNLRHLIIEANFDNVLFAVERSEECYIPLFPNLRSLVFEIDFGPGCRRATLYSDAAEEFWSRRVRPLRQLGAKKLDARVLAGRGEGDGPDNGRRVGAENGGATVERGKEGLDPEDVEMLRAQVARLYKQRVRSACEIVVFGAVAGTMDEEEMEMPQEVCRLSMILDEYNAYSRNDV